MVMMTISWLDFFRDTWQLNLVFSYFVFEIEVAYQRGFADASSLLHIYFIVNIRRGQFLIYNHHLSEMNLPEMLKVIDNEWVSSPLQ